MKDMKIYVGERLWVLFLFRQTCFGNSLGNLLEKIPAMEEVLLISQNNDTFH